MKDKIEIKNITNVDILNKFHKYFFKLTDLYITFVDKEGNFITSARAKRPFCVYLAKIGLKKKCDENNIAASKKYLSLKKPTTYKCYAGLGEIISPIIVKNQVIGAVLTGQIRVANYTKENFNKKIVDDNTKIHRLKKLYSQIPVLTKQQFSAAAKLIFLLINYIFEKQHDIVVYKGEFKTKKEDIITKAKNFLNQNYLRNFKIEELADKLHISPFYLCHLFKQKVGISIKDYVVNLKLKDALYLLKNTKLSIDKIIDKIGYKDKSYFYKLFKNRFKITPQEFRNNKKLHSKLSLKNFYKKIAI